MGLSGDVSGKMMYVICLNGLPFSVLSESTEADNYLAELQKVDPNEEWEIEQVPLGRHPEKDQAVWGSVGAWDLATGKLINYRRRWVWKCDLTTELPKVKEDEPTARFIWLTLPTTEEPDMIRYCRDYKKLVCHGVLNDTQVVVSK